MKRIMTVAVILQTICGITAQAATPGTWRSVGPNVAAVTVPIASHAPSRTIYVGLLKSTDGGATFVGLNDEFIGSPSLAMDPNNPNLVYAGGSKTTDGGATWTPMGGGYGFSLAIDPTDPNIVYSGAFSVEKTIDGGDTWTPASEGLGDSQVFALAINPFNRKVIFAASQGDGLFRSVNGAATWKRVSGLGSTVYGVLVDPDDGNVVYAGSNGNGVYKSTDGGASFVHAGTPRVGVVYSITKSGHKLYAGTAGGAAVSADGGVTWTDTGVSRSQGLVISSDSAGGVFLGTTFDGAFMLRNHTWQPLATQQLHHCACQMGHGLYIDPSDHNHVFFTTNDGGLLVTEDGGRTWQDGGIHGFVARASRGVAFDPQEPWRVYASSVAGGLFKSEDRGKHWTRRRFGTSTTYMTGISVDPVDHSVYVATLDNLGIGINGIWKSTDFGETFSRIDRAPHAPPGKFLDLVGRGITVDPLHHRTVYFADRYTGIWRSQDAGASWINVDPRGTMSITVDPTDSNIVYGAAADGVGVLKSINGGASFAVKSAGIPEDMTARSGSVLVNPKKPQVLRVAIEGDGIFESTNSGESWHPLNNGLADLLVFGLAMDPLFPNILYASTNSSVYKFSTAATN